MQIRKDRRQFERDWLLKYLEFWLDDGKECCGKVSSGKKVTGAIKSLVNTRSYDLDVHWYCIRVCSMPVLMYGMGQWNEGIRKDMGFGLYRWSVYRV